MTKLLVSPQCELSVTSALEDNIEVLAEALVRD